MTVSEHLAGLIRSEAKLSEFHAEVEFACLLRAESSPELEQRWADLRKSVEQTLWLNKELRTLYSSKIAAKTLDPWEEVDPRIEAEKSEERIDLGLSLLRQKLERLVADSDLSV